MKTKIGIVSAILLSMIVIIPMARAVIVPEIPIPVYVDVKPGSWPNPVNVHSKGRLAVAICGTEEFDVTTVDPVTVAIEGEVFPLRWSLEDAAIPYIADWNGGHEYEGGDGYVDLIVFFDIQEACALDWPGSVGETLPLVIKGKLFDGASIQGEDFVWIVG